MPPTFDRLTEAMAHEMAIAGLDYADAATIEDLKAAFAVALLEAIVVYGDGSLSDAYNALDAADTHMRTHGRYAALREEMHDAECDECASMWNKGGVN